MHFKKTGKFFPVTPFTEIDSAKAVLSEDAKFHSSKQRLNETQGWKVVEITTKKRVHLSELLAKIPEKTYDNIEELVQVLEIKQ